MKIVSLEEFKKLREKKRSEEIYRNYLSSLNQNQLEIEINSLLEEFSTDVYDKDFFSKGQLILKEITSRAAGPVRAQIEMLTKDTLRLLD